MNLIICKSKPRKKKLHEKLEVKKVVKSKATESWLKKKNGKVLSRLI
jgi:hypothetical protein